MHAKTEQCQYPGLTHTVPTRPVNQFLWISIWQPIIWGINKRTGVDVEVDIAVTAAYFFRGKYVGHIKGGPTPELALSSGVRVGRFESPLGDSVRRQNSLKNRNQRRVRVKKTRPEKKGYLI
jgi:hypothetical protein